MFNFLTLYIGYLRNSKKLIFVSIIGLTCALALISSSLIYIDSSKTDISNKIIQSSNNQSNYDISIQYSINYPYIDTSSFTKSINQFATNISNKLHLNIFSNLELFYSASNFFTPQKSSPTDQIKPAVNKSVIIVELNSALRNDLKNFISENF